MMTVRRILSAFLMLACVSAFGDNGSAVMLWFVDDPQVTVNGGGQVGVRDLPGWSADEDANELAARVRAVDDTPRCRQRGAFKGRHDGRPIRRVRANVVENAGVDLPSARAGAAEAKCNGDGCVLHDDLIIA